MKKTFWYVLIIVLVGIAIYANGLNGEFISDDHVVVVENIKIQNLPHFFSRYISFHVPLEVIFALNWHFFGMNTLPYHATNLIFHIFNAILVFLLMRAIFKNEALALFTALLFCAHTVNTQVVDWISSLGYAAMGTFYLLSVWFYVKFRSSSSRIHLYVISLLCFWFGLNICYALLTIPFILIAYEFILGQKDGAPFKDSLKYYLLILPFLCTILIYALLAGGEISQRLDTCTQLWLTNYRTAALPNHIAIISKLFIYYIKLLFWPYRLGISHRFMYNFAQIDKYLYISSFMILALIALIFVFKHLKKKELSFGLAWYLIAMLPYSNIIHVASDIAERYLYLPSIGFCLMISYLVLSFPSWCGRYLNPKSDQKKAAYATAIVFLSILTFYSALTVRRNSEYKTQISFWESNLKYFPLNGFVFNDLGNAYYRKGRTEDAIKSYQEALKLNPLDPKANYNLGVVFHQKGMLKEAFIQYQRTLKVTPEDAKSHFNLGSIYEKQNMLKEAISEYRQAIQFAPYYLSAYFKLGALLQMQNLHQEAISLYESALDLMPDSPPVLSNLGAAYYNVGWADKAKNAISRTIQIAPDFPQAYYNLGVIEVKEGNLEAAQNILTKLKELSPEFAQNLESSISRAK